MKLADETIETYRKQGQSAEVYFKFTCPHCGERCDFIEPNMLYESGECSKCGQTHPVHFAGFRLEIKIR